MRGVAAFLVLVSALAIEATSQAREPRDKAWLTSYVKQPIPAGARVADYVKAINAYPGDHYGVTPGLVAFFQSGSGTAMDPGRGNLWTLARLAWAHNTAGINFFHEATARQRIHDSLLGIANNIKTDGTFVWAPTSSAHENAWLFEAALLAFIWGEDYLSPAEATTVQTALRRTATWLANHSTVESSNQAAVWCASMSLAGLYFDEAAWTKLADANADAHVFGGKGNIYDDGEIGEHFASYGNGGGPDSNYTYTALSGIYPYRLWSGRSELDPVIVKGLRWLVGGYQTLSGWAIVPGASARHVAGLIGQVKDSLPLMERFSKSDPFFGATAASVLATTNKNASSQWVFSGHLGGAPIWDIYEAGAAASGTVPSWHSNRTVYYGEPTRTASTYALVSRSYQTGAVFSNGIAAGRDWPVKGIQSFAWGSEDPIIEIAGADDTASGSYCLAGGIRTDTTQTNVVGGVREVELRTQPRGDGWSVDLATLVYRQNALWTVVAYTPSSMVVAYGGPTGNYTTHWSSLVPPAHDPAARCFNYSGLTARICYLGGTAGTSPTGATVTSTDGAVFGFSNHSFTFGGLSGDILTFTDDSGGYALDLAAVLASGNVKRGGPFRLTVTSKGSGPPDSGSPIDFDSGTSPPNDSDSGTSPIDSSAETAPNDDTATSDGQGCGCSMKPCDPSPLGLLLLAFLGRRAGRSVARRSGSRVTIDT